MTNEKMLQLIENPAINELMRKSLAEKLGIKQKLSFYSTKVKFYTENEKSIKFINKTIYIVF